MAVVEPLIRTDAARPSVPAAPPAANRAVVRTALLSRLCAAQEVSVATIVAPAGYGKTTLLAQWAERDPRPVLAVELDPSVDDAATDSLLERIAEEPGLLVVVDDVHVLRSRPSLDLLKRLLGQIPAGTTIALAGRRLPALPLARLRAEGRLIEIATGELAFTGRDAEALLRRAGVLLPKLDAAALAERFEGWPATLFLAALSIRSGTPAASLGGDDPFVADYLEAECLDALSPAVRALARQISVLEELTPEACDSLLDDGCDSSELLESLERAGVVAQVDRHRHHFRYPRIVRELLTQELAECEPAKARELHRLAATRAAARGSTQEALEHAAAAGDLESVAKLAAGLALPECGRGRLEELEPWLELLHVDEGLLIPPPDLSIAAWWLYALRGSAEDAQRWADAAARGLSGDDPRLRVLQGLRCRDGVDQMLDDTTAAVNILPAGHPWRPAAVLGHGAALFLTGDTARAKPRLVEAVELAAAARATMLHAVGLCLGAIVATTEDAREDADAFAAEAAAVAAAEPPGESVVTLLLEAVEARDAAHGGDDADAADRLEHAERLLGHATYAVPWLAAMALLELVDGRVALGDPDGARTLLRRVGDVLRVRPRLGVLVQRTAELDGRTHALAEPAGRRASSLTPAELRLLPLLATHLSFREIGERLYISRNTVKTEAIAVYRKFGVTSRSAAISRAVAYGLIDDNAVTTRDPLHGGSRAAAP